MIFLQYLIQLEMYQAGAYALFDKKPRIPWAQTAGMGICVFLYMFPLMPASVEGALIAWMAVFVSMRGNVRERIFRILVLIIFISGMGEIFDLLKWFLHIEDHVVFLILDSLFINMIFLFIYNFRKAGKREISIKWYGRVALLAPVLLAVVIIALFLTVLGLIYAYDRIDIETFRMFVRFVVGAAFVSVWILGLFLFYARSANERLSEAGRREQELRIMQKDYYELLLEREEDTKKFRHELNNHLICLNELADGNKIMQIKEYLSGMRQDMKKIQRKKVDMGDEVLDALTAHYVLGLDKEIKTHLETHLTHEIRISCSDLCTIYGNLLKNAVEELERHKRGKLRVDVWSDTEWLRIEIINTVGGAVDLSRTRKRNRNDHGYGIENVREKVQKYGGILLFEQEGNELRVKVSLSNKFYDR